MAAYEHLPLKRLEGVFERRIHGFGAAPPRDAKQHGARIQEEIEDTVSSFNELPAIDGIDPSLILKVSIAGNIDEDEWRKVGLTVLSVDGDKSVVLFANDKSLQDFRNKVEAYQGELPLGQKAPQFAGLVAAIESVSLLSAADRIGPLLQDAGIKGPEDFIATDNYVLDFELYRPPTQGEADIFVYRLKQALASGGTILSTYSGYQMLIARLECNGDAVRAALELPEVAVADIPPQPDLITEDLADLDIEQFSPGKLPPPDAITIGVIDSGVNFGHPLLAGIEAGAITLNQTWSVSDVVGHGTSVASIAAFGDIAARVAAKNFDAQFRIASARVVTDSGQFPKEQSVPDLMEKAIRKLHDDYACRIFNVSLGNAKRIYKGGKPDPWAATLDALARDLDVLIIVSAGTRGLNEKSALMVCGHGVSIPDHAATSDDGRVVLFAEEELLLDHFAVFEVPIPSEFQTTKGTRDIKVALAFDPPVRHTRADYLGVTMGWRLLRGTSEKDVFDRYRKWTKEEGKPPEFPNRLVCPTDIGSDLREFGTLQVATYRGKTDISKYGDKYYVAVWCSRRWAPAAVEMQRYALCVQLRHENVTTLYQTLRQPVRLQA